MPNLTQNAQPESLAFEKLCGDSWAARLPRSLTTDRSIPFGAVVVYAAACVWRDRGPAWGFTDDDEVFTRTSAAIPPGGWPHWWVALRTRGAGGEMQPWWRPDPDREPAPAHSPHGEARGRRAIREG